MDDPDAVPLNIKKATITFDNLRFQYGGDTSGLDGINLDIQAGERLGIVGASGAGKSTLVIDGQDLRGLQQESLRRHIGMVTQETAMFNRSAHDNILHGNPSATEANLIAAAKKAEADDFIRDLKDFEDRKG